MLTIEIPGLQALHLEHLVLDLNGTLACDGMLLDGVSGLLQQMRDVCEALQLLLNPLRLAATLRT